ncbi:MAG: GLPGLI family protein [Bacteroidia bacterium]
MKKLILSITALATISIAVAQKNSGRVNYEEKVKLNIQLDSNAMDMPDLPKEKTISTELLFTADASLYQLNKAKQKDESIDHEEDGNRVVIKMDIPDNKVYYDIKNKKRIEQKDFMSRKFLIETTMDKSQWKLTGNQKTILNYPCQEATMTDNGKKIIAWFTSAIEAFSGPSVYIGLPGFVMAVDVNDGERTITATSVELQPIDQKLLVQPKEGKKVTQTEYDKIVEEKRKEMQKEYGGNGNMIIKIKN